MAKTTWTPEIQVSVPSIYVQKKNTEAFWHIRLASWKWNKTCTMNYRSILGTPCISPFFLCNALYCHLTVSWTWDSQIQNTASLRSSRLWSKQLHYSCYPEGNTTHPYMCECVVRIHTAKEPGWHIISRFPLVLCVPIIPSSGRKNNNNKQLGKIKQS